MLAAATVGFGMIQLDVSVVNVAVKPISAALGGGVTGLQWVVDAYTLTFAALILSAGALGDRRGAKRVLLGGFAVFTAASVACGLAPAIGALVAALVAALSVTGFGIGLIVTAITAALLGSVDPSFSGIASGTLTAFRQTGSVLGVALYGSLLASTGATAGLRTACAISIGLILVIAALSLTTR